MASRNFDATQTPRSIASVLGLPDGVDYVGQNVSTTATLFVRDAAVSPPRTMRAFRHESGGFFYFTPGGTTALWVWTDDADGCPVIVTEA